MFRNDFKKANLMKNYEITVVEKDYDAEILPQDIREGYTFNS